MLERLTARGLALAASLGSALLLAGAFAFQAAGYAPCELCILQRWPHLAAAVAGALVAVLGWRRWLAALVAGVAVLAFGWRKALSAVGLLAALAATAFAIFHVGVEWQWWEGPMACTGGMGDIATLSTAELMTRLSEAKVVRCDQPSFVFLGLSMAGWNAVCSAALSVLWALSLRRPRVAASR